MNTADFIARLKEVLEGHDFLILGLNTFLPKRYHISPYERHLSADRPEQHNVDKAVIKVQKKETKRVKNKTVVDRSKERKSPDLDNKKHSDKKFEMDVTKSIQALNLTKGERCHNDVDNKSHYLKPREVNLSKCKRHISYVRLPKDYQSPIASGRSELDASVLNDQWVLKPRSMDYSNSKHKINKYQEALFKCEDDQFEADMLIESVRSASERVEEVYDDIVENKISLEGPLRIEEHFRTPQLRCIERMYGELGLEALDALRRNPIVVLPVMLTRLKQKHEDLCRSRLESNKIWARVYAENHSKSLDHRS